MNKQKKKKVKIKYKKLKVITRVQIVEIVQ